MIFVFDLDGTLAELGKGIQASDVQLLHTIASAGHTIALCSGKPTYYLCGFMRQVGIPNCILIGENGATIQFGVDLPPARRYRLPISNIAKQNLVKLKETLDKTISPEIWYQPNEVCLTPFPRTEEEFSLIQNLIDTHPEMMVALSCYRHCDSFDFAPAEVNKGSALQYLCTLLDQSPNDFIAIGDGPNDAPMFRFCGTSLGIRFPDDSAVDHNFESPTAALQFILLNWPKN